MLSDQAPKTVLISQMHSRLDIQDADVEFGKREVSAGVSYSSWGILFRPGLCTFHVGQYRAPLSAAITRSNPRGKPGEQVQHPGADPGLEAVGFVLNGDGL
ncbi:MAG: hypothetical protein EOP48_22050 [Sphingobacteriales bacterium]|nr:MAG: hypothetical protein EOP48_22050 [Sphingobacteriales bacterium]